MSTYLGSSYGFDIEETSFTSTEVLITITFVNALIPAAANVYQLQYRVIGAGTWISSPPFYMSNPGTIVVPKGNNEYRVQLFYNDGTPFEYISFVLQVIATNNFLYVPELNPLIFWELNKRMLPNFNTKFMEDFEFSERGYWWQDREVYCQPWQTTDIISLQLASTFSPLILSIKNEYGDVVLQRSASATVPHLNYPGLFVYEFHMSLAGLAGGCYTAELLAGFGIYQKIYFTWHLFISDTALENTFLIKYKSSRQVHKDVVFANGMEFQLRVPGCMGPLNKVRKDEMYRNQSYGSTLINSKSAKQYPFSFGDEWGLPDDMINLIDEIFSCDIVTIDNKLFGLAEGSKIETPDAKRSRKRGLKMILEDGLNRNSRVFQTIQDPNKRLIVTGMTSPRIWGVQTGTNTIPVTNIE